MSQMTLFSQLCAPGVALSQPGQTVWRVQRSFDDMTGEADKVHCV